MPKSEQRYDDSFFLHVPNHDLKDMYMRNYGTINNTSSLCYISIEVEINFINFVVAIHVFYKQLHFLLQPRVTYGRMNFHSEICLAVAYSIHFQSLVA